MMIMWPAFELFLAGFIAGAVGEGIALLCIMAYWLRRK